MNTKNLLLLVCILGFSTLAFADIDISIEQVDANGQIVDQTARLLAEEGEYSCTMTLYSKELLQAGGLAARIGIYGPPYTGEIGNLGRLGVSPSYINNLYRIVYSGPHCDCTVTVYQETGPAGKSKDYYATTAIGSSADNKIDLDWCWRNKAQSLTVTCTV